MNKMAIVAFAALLCTVGFAGSVNSSLGTFLKGYIGNESASLAYSGSGFAVVQVGSGYIAVNTSPYALITSQQSAFNALKAFMLSGHAFNSTQISALSNDVSALRAGSKSGFDACLATTGLNSTFLPINSTKGCSAVATCSNLLSNAVVGGVLQIGISNFSRQYNIFNRSYNSFEAAIGKVNSNNYYEYAGLLSKYALALANVPGALVQNPLFDAPGNITSAMYKVCPTFPTAGTLQEFPWYCSMTGYCQNIGFNNNYISEVKGIALQLQGVPTNASIATAASAAATLAENYELNSSHGNMTLFNEFLNSSSGTVDSAMALSANVANSTLSGAINQYNYTLKGIRQSLYSNLTSAEHSISTILSSMENITSKLSLQYYSVVNLSLENEALLLRKQLDMPGSAAIAPLAAMQANMSAQLSTRIPSNSLPAIKANLTALNSRIAATGSSYTIQAFIKGVDSWFIGPLANTQQTVQGRMDSAPLYAALLSVIIGAIVLAATYMCTYYRLSRNRRIRKGRRFRGAWMRLFALMVVAIAVYAAVTYVWASGNPALPIDGFFGAVSSSSSVAIAVNSSIASNSVLQCAASLSANLQDNGKSVSTVRVSGYECSGNSTSCLADSMASGTPVILISGSAPSAYRGMYGYVFNANESFSSGSACQLAKLFDRVS